MKISEGGRGKGGPFERMDHAQLIQGFSEQTKVADAHFLVSVVELTPFLSISTKGNNRTVFYPQQRL